MINLVISRTFDGYMTEIETIYGQLEKILEIKIEPAPDEWDRLFNVDFYIQINEKYIGLQIKPVNKGYNFQRFSKKEPFKKKPTSNLLKYLAEKFFMSFQQK